MYKSRKEIEINFHYSFNKKKTHMNLNREFSFCNKLATLTQKKGTS